MIGKHERRNLLVDEIEIQALLLRNKIADIIQDEFAREMMKWCMKKRGAVVRDVK